MDYEEIAREIITNVGGKENIANLTHCFTRLRFELKAVDQVNTEKLNQVEGVISTLYSSGQYQVVIGNKVEKVFDAVQDKLGPAQSSTSSTHSVKERLLILVTQIFTPVVPAIAASGLIKGLLTAAKLLLQRVLGIDISTSDTYNLLFMASQVIFYFMPIFLAYTAAKALKVDKFSAMVLGGFLVYPQVNDMMLDYKTAASMFGMPFVKGAWGSGDNLRVFSYVESVIPIILTVAVLYYLEKGLKRVVPDILKIILVPGLSLIIMLPIMLGITGPIGIYLGNGIQAAYNAVMTFSPLLGGALIGGGWGIFVIFGAHRALLPIGLNDVALTGKQNLLAFAGAANFAQGGSVLGVALKTKNKELKSVSWSALISAVLVGITEPAIYGANLRLKKPMLAAIISGAVGGAIMGLGNVYGDAFANNGVLTIFTYAAFGMTSFMYYLVGCLVAFIGAVGLTYLLGFEDIPDQVSDRQDELGAANQEDMRITSPVSGRLIPVESVNDPVFSKNMMGKSVAIVAEKGTLVAPASARVTMLCKTQHALGLRLDNGFDLLIHLGINTVELNGAFFDMQVAVGDRVVAHQGLGTFDIAKIKAAGYDPTVLIVLTNNEKFGLKGLQETQLVTIDDAIYIK
ncbi:glucose PTS transporter subunit IIA [Pseudolactococcus piscium]|nr:glucose PTS transporter subunit IIA [Lactococcus piscium]